MLVQSNFNLKWEKNSSLQPFKTKKNNNSFDEENTINRTPHNPAFSILQTQIKKKELGQTSINLNQIRELEKQNLREKKGFLNKNLEQKSTAVDLEMSKSKREPISQKMIQEIKFGKNENSENWEKTNFDKRRIWEIKAQIAREIFGLSKFGFFKINSKR